jgi:hypothetical protein
MDKLSKLSLSDRSLYTNIKKMSHNHKDHDTDNDDNNDDDDEDDDNNNNKQIKVDKEEEEENNENETFRDEDDLDREEKENLFKQEDDLGSLNSKISPQKEEDEEEEEMAPIPIPIDESRPYPDFVDKALGCLTQTSFPRYFCIRLCKSIWFERISLSVIILNCLTLALFQPCEDIVCASLRCKIIDYIDDCIFIYFILEMCIKIVGLGFIGKRTYLGETWNILDFFIVLTGYFVFFFFSFCFCFNF